MSGGSLTNAGDGILYSVSPIFYQTWTATQTTTFMDNTGSWAGSSFAGAYDYDADIAAMRSNQLAVGIYWNWGTSQAVALLSIFNSVDGMCVSPAIAADNGPFVDSEFAFSGMGTASAVSVPVAAWLMGSGLLGLVGLARRRRMV